MNKRILVIAILVSVLTSLTGAYIFSKQFKHTQIIEVQTGNHDAQPIKYQASSSGAVNFV